MDIISKHLEHRDSKIRRMQAEYWDLEIKYKESQELVSQLTQKNLNQTLRELFLNNLKQDNERNSNLLTRKNLLNISYDARTPLTSCFGSKTEENSFSKLKDIFVPKTELN